MNLLALESNERSLLAVAYNRDGMAVARSFCLPNTFDPPETDCVFLQRDGECEIFFGANTRYHGPSATWCAIQARPVAAGRARLVASASGDFSAGLSALQNLLQQAGGEYAAPDVETLTDMEEVQAQLPDENEIYVPEESQLFAGLRSEVRGQDAALSTLARRVCLHLSRRRPRRPLTLFFVGPTGVGKTRAAQTLAEQLRAMSQQAGTRAANAYDYLRLDMAEYSEAHRVSQLLGAPQSYVGYGDGAQLTDALAANPRTIVLLDEIEKAHPQVVKTLMNAWDAGLLSSARATAQGREIDCREAIFLCTSNLQAESVLAELQGRNAFDDAQLTDDVCRRHLRDAGLAPELAGRITSFLVFGPLNSRARAEVMALAVKRVAAEYDVQVGYIEPSVILALMERAGDTDFGARPDEYLTDEVLGEAFAQATQAQTLQPVAVCGGPPFSCCPVHQASRYQNDELLAEGVEPTTFRI